MLMFLALCAALYLLGAVMKTPVRVRLTMIAVLYGAVVLLQLVLPRGHAMRDSLGGSAAPWLMVGGAVVLILIYREGLGWLKSRAKPSGAPDPAQSGPSTEELERYARHIVLRELGGPGQMRLRKSKVLVIGAGGLGAPALQYLAAAGVGTIGVIDDDVVDSGNLQRQVIHRDADIGKPKVFSAEAAMKALNPYVTVRPYQRRLDAESADALFAEYDLILDGTDNFTTRYLANAAAVRHGKPLVSGALSQWEGQLSVFDPAKDGPCYQCVFPEAPAPGLAPSCAEAGVLGPLPGVVGAMMAVEAVKILAQAGQPLRGEMLIYDALWGETRKITLKKRADCPVCGNALATDGGAA
ncbi:HesA/MoeB/ThiF family protein [Pseudoprimorskyibacter insulae]|uniref:Molybdopterin-synthase adenylyltransferase n=1 Tax=Pseudoprimorskyibacter insulae TaxID=1695997 RepID=A0A2R8ANJ0_9RHOB|nr:molybdopterin-synthase adenylyltransferase MoeB [Pseudoprimorskyibacter insulae]SPF77611.1 putative adenylyltransferase/sulfurtransferase MoeZ [Pseudoprimorskyibacter insulae]